MVKGINEVFDALEVDHSDKKFSYLSNYNKFQAAKDNGIIKDHYAEILEFVKFEQAHANRPLVISRLFALALSDYKSRLRSELGIC